MSSKGDKPDDPPASQTETEKRLEALLARYEALEAKVTALEDGEKQWTEKNLSPLRQQIADLQATLQEIPPNVTGQVKTLRDELTQQLQELQQAVAPPNPSPPANPDQPPAPPQETPPDQPPQPPAPSGAGAHPDQPTAPPSRKGKRVI